MKSDKKEIVSDMNRLVIERFVSAINEHDVSGLCELMAEDPVFIDAHGNSLSGKSAMEAGWRGYFRWFPDYAIELEAMHGDGHEFLLHGFASGRFSGSHNGSNHFHLPAAWRVQVEQQKIKLWQVFCDTKIPFEIIQKNQ